MNASPQPCPTCGKDLRFEVLNKGGESPKALLGFCMECGAGLIRENASEPYRAMTAEEKEQHKGALGLPRLMRFAMREKATR